MKKSKGFAGMDFNQIMMQQAMKQVNEPIYCRYCGKDFKRVTDENDQEWALKYSSHTDCHRDHIRKEQAKFESQFKTYFNK